MFFTLGCSMAKEHAVFKNKLNEYYSTKLNETSFVDKIYDIKSYYVLNLICQKLFLPESKVHCLRIFLITLVYLHVYITSLWIHHLYWATRKITPSIKMSIEHIDMLYGHVYWLCYRYSVPLDPLDTSPSLIIYTAIPLCHKSAPIPKATVAMTTFRGLSFGSFARFLNMLSFNWL